MRPFRFLAVVSTPVDGRTLAELARRAEATGFSALVVPDHLIDQMAPVPTMAYVAAATEWLRIGSFVINNDLRHPAVLAHDLATLDVLSGGRLEIGIGAGWNVPEYTETGLSFDPVGTRVGRLAEAITVLKGCFGEEPFSFRGEHYELDGYDGRPKPVQRPHPPLMIGGGGRRVLALAGREADIVSFAPRTLPGQVRDPRSITLAATEEKVGWVRQAAGERFAELELNVYPSGVAPLLTDRARQEAEALADRFREQSGLEISAGEVLESPHFYVGTVDSLVDKLRSLRERLGISSFMVGEVGELDPVVERLAGT
jgi:probable F420-dependent oxidoreductase